MKSKRGYTVAEILIVTAILCIVMAISIVLTFGQIQKARNIAALSTMSSINSMYRTAAAIAQSDRGTWEQSTVTAQPVSLPAVLGSSAYEKFLTESMNSSFAELESIEYTLTDKNGIENAGEIYITYWPKKGEFEHYIWHDGAVVRYYLEDKYEVVKK